MKLLVVAFALLFTSCTFASPTYPPWGTQAILVEAPLDTNPKTPSATVSSVRYGPFPLSAGGALRDKLLEKIKKPCGDCYIVAIQAQLEDSNQRERFTESGLWLHHAILFNTAQSDLTCSYMAGERFYGGDHTKVTRRWNNHGRWGYHVNADDKWALVVDLLNEGDVDVELVVRIDFEWVSASSAEGRQYRGVRPIWLCLSDLCSDSSIPVTSVTKPFSLRTPEWISTIDGPLVDVAGHVHDGGVDLTTYQNGKEICRSTPLYGHGRESHIIGRGTCKDVGHLKKGDVLTAEVRYDPGKHPYVLRNGKPKPVMGADGLYVGVI